MVWDQSFLALYDASRDWRFLLRCANADNAFLHPTRIVLGTLVVLPTPCLPATGDVMDLYGAARHSQNFAKGDV